ISQEEYFRFFAFLNNTADTDKKDESPTIEIYTDEQRQQKSEWEAELARLQKITTTTTPELAAARDAWAARFPEPIAWTRYQNLTASARSAKPLTVTEDGLVHIADPAETDVLTLTASPANDERTITALQLDASGAGHNFVVTRVAAALIPPGSTSLMGRYVRVELPGSEKMLSLAEVQVYSGADNIARTGKATQSTTDFRGPPELAIDGNTNGDYRAAMSTTHTAISKDPWWEVDLGEVRPLDRLVLWNRTDNGLQSRLNGCVVIVLDADRQEVFRDTLAEAPQESREFALSGIRGISLTRATADFEQTGFEAGSVLVAKSDPEKGWAVAPQQGDPHKLTLVPAKPVAVPAGWSLQVTVEQLSKHLNHTLHRVGLSETADPRAAEQAGYPTDVNVILAKSAEQRSEAELARLTEFYLGIAPKLAPQRKQLAAVQKRLADQKAYTTVPVLRALPADQQRETRLQFRGNFLDKGDVVTAGVPNAFPAIPGDAPMNRLSLAHWLISRDNPLTARVTVNRLWEKLFGIGIVRTVEEFGSQGELPSHPELLDWLAVEFMDSDWDVRHMLKLMVMSAAYRQSSLVTPDLAARDPENRLLARGPRFR
ncbi:MAG: DUF1553 domain-containing protein, partial [Planctomycetaceae bacterium]|nr:DUF1553 domain-containing protein [Planctomycetaceae bacterium]